MVLAFHLPDDDVAPSSPGSAKTVLVVEDDPTLLRVEESVLRDAGYAADCLGDANAARQKAMTVPYSGIVFDVTVSGSDGYQTAAQIGGADANRHTPLIIVGTDEPDARKRAFDAGALAFISKPFTAEGFRSAIFSVMSAAGPPLAGPPRAASRTPSRAPTVRIPLTPPRAAPAPRSERYAPMPDDEPTPPGRSESVRRGDAIPVSFQGGQVYWCEPDAEGNWRCGRCETGVIASGQIGGRCSICQAEVVTLEERSGSGGGWLVVLVLLVLGAAAAWYFLS
jgi:CheY-like chemotaxis protein